MHVCTSTLLTLMNYCSFDLFSQWWQSVSKKICDSEEEKWGVAFLSGELAWVQFEMLFGDLSWSMNQKAGGEKSSAEMVIFMTAEARAALHSLGFLRFSCTVVFRNGNGVTLWHQSQQSSCVRLLEIRFELCVVFKHNVTWAAVSGNSKRHFLKMRVFYYTIYSSNSFAGWLILKWRLKKQQLCDSADVWMSWGGGGRWPEARQNTEAGMRHSGEHADIGHSRRCPEGRLCTNPTL